jgi:hypothetical protein
VDTPNFVAVGTNGTLKAVDHRQADDAGLQLMFCNTYHLLLQPGPDTIAAAGGLHKCVAWLCAEACDALTGQLLARDSRPPKQSTHGVLQLPWSSTPSRTALCQLGSVCDSAQCASARPASSRRWEGTESDTTASMYERAWHPHECTLSGGLLCYVRQVCEPDKAYHHG